MTSHSLKAANLNAKLPIAQTARHNVKLIEPSENQPVKLKQLLGHTKGRMKRQTWTLKYTANVKL